MKILSFIQRFSSGKALLFLMVPTIIVYFTMLFHTLPQVAGHAGGMALFDLMPTGYSHDYAVKLLDALGTDGRDLYLYKQLPLDFIYPALFAVSCSFLLSWLLLKSQKTHSKLFFFCFVPIAAGLFDYFENLFLVSMLLSYPIVSETSTAIASFMTIAKSSLTTVFFVLLVPAIALRLIKRNAMAK